MANLEERIASWRRNLAETLGGSAEALEELEGHLRDDVQRRFAQGETADAAFAAAAAQLGNPAAVAAEFVRDTPPAPWLPVRLAIVVLIAGAGWLAGILTPRLGDSLGALLAVHVAAITLGYSITLLVGALAACYLVARPFGVPGVPQRESLVRATSHLTLAALMLTGLGIVLGGFWAQERWGQFWSWDAKETAAALVLLWDAAMLVILNKRLLGAHALLVLGLAGNVVVALAWIGPHVLGLGLHAYGYSPLALPLVLFVLSQIALSCLGFVPAGALTRRMRQS